MSKRNDGLAFASSVVDDVWHPKTSSTGFESWHFSAISDDGREVVFIDFFDNLFFSPRYFKNLDLLETNRVPAVSFSYYHNEKTVYTAINEYTASDFSIVSTAPFCKIDENIFQIESTPYGIRYKIFINLELSGNKKLKAAFEFLLIESNFLPTKTITNDHRHHWNIVSTRSDVTGKMEILDQTDTAIDVRQFRGSGSHERNLEMRFLPETLQKWQCGRVHFANRSLVFVNYKEFDREPESILLLAEDNQLKRREHNFKEARYTYNAWGHKYPTHLALSTDDGSSLLVKQTTLLESSPFFLRFLSSFEYKTSDGRMFKAFGLTEQLSAKKLKSKVIRKIIDLKIIKIN